LLRGCEPAKRNPRKSNTWIYKETRVDERLKKRILAFYFAGMVNLVLGVYVLVAGAAHMGQGTALLVALFFLGFAAVDFYFVKAMKKKWIDEQTKMTGGSREPDRAT
jgi:hypothetical protein